LTSWGGEKGVNGIGLPLDSASSKAAVPGVAPVSWRAHHVKVQMRGERVTGVPYQAEDLAALDRIARVNADFSLLKVSVERVVAVAEIEDYTIPVRFFDFDIGGILAGSLAWILIGDGNDFGVGDGEGFLAVDGVALVFILRAVVDAVLIVDLFPIDGVTLCDPDAAVHGKSGAGVTSGVTAGIGGNVTGAAERWTNHGNGLAIDRDVSTIFGEILLAWGRGIGVKFDAMRKFFRDGLRVRETEVKEELRAGTGGEI
jgi:hypothetical protein